VDVHQFLIFVRQTLPECVLNNAADRLIAKTRERLQQLIQTGGDVKAQFGLFFLGHLICLTLAQGIPKQSYPALWPIPDAREFSLCRIAELSNFVYIDS